MALGGGEPLVNTRACGETIRASPPPNQLGRHGIDVFEYHSEMVNIEWKPSRDSEIIQYSSARGDSMQYNLDPKGISRINMGIVH